MNSLNKSKIIQISIFAVLAGGILVFVALFSIKAPLTKAGSADNVFGWAWSENIGWISFAPSGPYPGAPAYSAQLDTVLLLAGQSLG